jgi:hypothetical protein
MCCCSKARAVIIAYDFVGNEKEKNKALMPIFCLGKGLRKGVNPLLG